MKIQNLYLRLFFLHNNIIKFNSLIELSILYKLVN